MKYGQITAKVVTPRGEGGAVTPSQVSTYGWVVITPPRVRATGSVVQTASPIRCAIDHTGVLRDPDGNEGCWVLASDQGDGVALPYSVRVEPAGIGRPVEFDMLVLTGENDLSVALYAALNDMETVGGTPNPMPELSAILASHPWQFWPQWETSGTVARALVGDDMTYSSAVTGADVSLGVLPSLPAVAKSFSGLAGVDHRGADGSFTWACAVYVPPPVSPAPGSTVYATLLTRGWVGSGVTLYARIATSGIVDLLDFGTALNGTSYEAAQSNPSVGWHVVACVHDEGARMNRIYVDGVLAGSKTGLPAGTGVTTSAAVSMPATGAPYGIQRSAPALYRRVLTDTEIADLSAAIMGQRVGAVRNLCRYPNAESGATTGWVESSATVTVSGDAAHSGTRSYKVVTSGAATNEGITQDSAVAVLPASSGTTNPETCSAWVKAPSGANLRLAMEQFTPVGSFVRTVAYTDFIATGDWQRVSASGAKTVAEDAIRTWMRTTTTAQAITFYVDDALNQNTSELVDYFDGDSPQCYWEGAPGASPSVWLPGYETPRLTPSRRDAVARKMLATHYGI